MMTEEEKERVLDELQLSDVLRILIRRDCYDNPQRPLPCITVGDTFNVYVQSDDGPYQITFVPNKTLSHQWWRDPAKARESTELQPEAPSEPFVPSARRLRIRNKE